MAQKTPPFRAEHMGSLLRPEKLFKARAAYESGQADRTSLVAVEDDAVKEIIDLQVDCGFRGISDGEFRRGVFWGEFFQWLDGFEEIQNPSMDIFRPYVPDIAGFIEKGGIGQSAICTGKIKHTGKSSLIDQFNSTKSHLPKERWGDIKLTMISPVWYHLRYKEGKAFPSNVYSSEEEYFMDIAEAFRTELDILYEAGLRNVQIDDPNLAYFCSEKMIAGWAEDKSNKKTPEQLLDLYIETYNDCIRAHKDKIHFGVHLCRGNFRGSRHFSEGGYDRIATKLFRKLNVSTYYLEYDTPRAGTFEPLLHLPAHKNVILGVITTKFAELEDVEAMKERIYSAAEVIAKGNGQSKEEALDRIGVSPQCGFSSHFEGNNIEWKDMENKLKLVRKIADEVWPGQP